MSQSMTISQNVSIGGKSYPRNKTPLTGEALYAREVTLGAAKVGELTTRTDNDTGTLTMVTGHGITTGATIDIYWVGGSRRGVTVGAVAGDSVPFDTGAGDNLPALNTDVTVQVVDEEVCDLVGDNLVGLAIYMDNPGTVVLLDSGDAELFSFVTALTKDGFVWDSANHYTNPIAGDTVASFRCTNSDSTKTGDVRVAAVYN